MLRFVLDFQPDSCEDNVPSLTRQQHSFAVLPDAFTAEYFVHLLLDNSKVRHRIGSLSNGSQMTNGEGLHMAPIAEDETRWDLTNLTFFHQIAAYGKCIVQCFSFDAKFILFCRLSSCNCFCL